MRFHLSLAAAALFFAVPLSAFSDAHEMPIWMTGAWEHAAGDDWADEYWTPLRGDMMIGASRSGTGDTLKFWEHMRIQKEDDGAVVLWAIAADHKPVRFEATMSMENRMAFENAAHDYPQRIEYWREGNELKAEISLLDGSKLVAFRFTLQ
jgi:Domain of unknown function (DUF6265)